MKKRKIAGALLALLLFGGGCAALAVGGTTSDPLISLNYINNTYVPDVTNQMASRVQEQTAQAYAEAEQRLQQEAAALMGQVGGESGLISGNLQLKREDQLTINAGAGLVWLSGSAKVTHSGTVIDVTTGETVVSGADLAVNHRYLVAEDTTAVFSIYSEAAGGVAQGGAAVAYSTFDAMPFTDIKSTDWYCESVRYVYDQALFNGVSATIFSPNTQMTRAMLATVLHRLAGKPSVEGMENPFADVPEGQYYTDAVTWAAKVGIVTGRSAETFDPNGVVSREQMATMLYRYAGEYMGLPVAEGADLTTFPDGDKTAAWAKDGMSWVVAKGIVQGSDGKLLPQNTASRCQVAAMLQRFSALL